MVQFHIVWRTAAAHHILVSMADDGGTDIEQSTLFSTYAERNGLDSVLHFGSCTLVLMHLLLGD